MTSRTGDTAEPDAQRPVVPMLAGHVKAATAPVRIPMKADPAAVLLASPGHIHEQGYVPLRTSSSAESGQYLKEQHDGIATYNPPSWDTFPLLIESLVSESEFVFRGQRQGWRLLSQLDRLELKTGTPIDRERLLEQFKRGCLGRRGPNPPIPRDDDDWWALGRHYGLMTPLLDFTVYPYVAAFFAFEEEDSEEDEPYRVIYCLNQSALCPGTELKIWTPESHDNPRLISQGSLFARLLTECTPLEDWIQVHGFLEPVLLRVELPSRYRQQALKALNLMNINRQSLFPDLSGTAEYCNMSLRLAGYALCLPPASDLVGATGTDEPDRGRG